MLCLNDLVKNKKGIVDKDKEIIRMVQESRVKQRRGWDFFNLFFFFVFEEILTAVYEVEVIVLGLT